MKGKKLEEKKKTHTMGGAFYRGPTRLTKGEGAI